MLGDKQKRGLKDVGVKFLPGDLVYVVTEDTIYKKDRCQTCHGTGKISRGEKIRPLTCRICHSGGYTSTQFPIYKPSDSLFVKEIQIRAVHKMCEDGVYDHTIYHFLYYLVNFGTYDEYDYDNDDYKYHENEIFTSKEECAKYCKKLNRERYLKQDPARYQFDFKVKQKGM